MVTANYYRADLERCSEKQQWGELTLPDGIRPHPDGITHLKRGYMQTHYCGDGHYIPTIIVNESASNLFDLFYELTHKLTEAPLDLAVPIVKTTNEQNVSTEWYGDEKELCLIQSDLCEFEHQIVNDGHLGISIVNSTKCQEVLFDDHKILCIYSNNYLHHFETVLQSHGLKRVSTLECVIDGPHIHFSDNTFAFSRQKLITRLNAHPQDGE